MEQQERVRTVVSVSNLHCPSCVATIQDCLNRLTPSPLGVSASLVKQTVDVVHPPALDSGLVFKCLLEQGFEVQAGSRNGDAVKVADLDQSAQMPEPAGQLRHKQYCEVCEQENKSPAQSEGHESRDAARSKLYRCKLALSGMTCVNCVRTITDALASVSSVQDPKVDLMTHSAIYSTTDPDDFGKVKQVIDDAGYDCEFISSDVIDKAKEQSKGFKYQLSVQGMHCASCVGKITEALEGVQAFSKVNVDLMSNSAAFESTDGSLQDEALQAVRDTGYDATVNSVRELSQDSEGQTRKLALRIHGMFCDHCCAKVKRTMDDLAEWVTCISLPTLNNPILRIEYTPTPPERTIRFVVDAIGDLGFDARLEKPPSVEEISRDMQRQEQHRLSRMIVWCAVLAIPTAFFGVVVMSLLPPKNKARDLFMRPVWGQLNWLTIVLFLFATPVQFGIAIMFHQRALKGIYTLWRKGSNTPLWKRFFRFGSMDLLISSATSVAYFASVALGVIAITLPPDDEGPAMDTYFDSTVFLTLFILIGRYLETFSRLKTADAVSTLGKLSPETSLVLPQVQQVPTDFVELNDTVRIPAGKVAPVDGVVVSGSTAFNESALTGESISVEKSKDSKVFAGTINTANSVDVKVTAIQNQTFLAGILDVVRQGQSRQAPVERVADTITAYFVPVVTALATITWVVWFSLGESGVLPDDYLDTRAFGWAFWALKFSIAVFVIACPCGIGLAAPTACFVGGSVSASHGILAQAGGEAFQEGSYVTCVVFDKTGTLTVGGEPQVNHASFNDTMPKDVIKALVWELESYSTHPLAKACRDYCRDQKDARIQLRNVEEHAGLGLSCQALLQDKEYLVILGNEKMMQKRNAKQSDPSWRNSLDDWKSQGDSVVLVALKESESESDFELVAQFGASDSLRPEAKYVVSKLQQSGISTWMITGDNNVTARAVARHVGIPEENVISEVLPVDKSDRIHRLQMTAGSAQKTWISGKRKGLNERGRAIVAMVGDGINDAPALSAADVAIAIGSGSDIAIDSAHFILINSSLLGVLELLHISKVVYRRIKFNFGWAMVYNIIGIPIAAGVLYPFGYTLDPVWASLAMALSSVSVVASSFALNLYRSPSSVTGFDTQDTR